MATSPNFTRLTTVSVVLTNAMNSIGLTPPADMLGSTDQTVTQLVQLLNEVGTDLCTMHDWQMLHKEWSFNTTPAVTEYALPEDWNGFVSGAQWDTSTRLPMTGSMPAPIWRLLKARVGAGGSLITLSYKLQADELVLFTAPAAAEALVLDYYSRGWLRDGTEATVFRDNAQNNTDVVLLDSRLVEALLKLRWRASKGFDTTASVLEFNELWDTIVGRDAPAATLSVGRSQDDGLLGNINIPDTGYGS
jgi:hypothetical protein